MDGACASQRSDAQPDHTEPHDDARPHGDAIAILGTHSIADAEVRWPIPRHACSVQHVETHLRLKGLCCLDSAAVGSNRFTIEGAVASASGRVIRRMKGRALAQLQHR